MSLQFETETKMDPPDEGRIAAYELLAEIEALVFTAARNWERRVTIRREHRDEIAAMLRAGIESRPSKAEQKR